MSLRLFEQQGVYCYAYYPAIQSSFHTLVIGGRDQLVFVQPRPPQKHMIGDLFVFTTWNQAKEVMGPTFNHN